jgi:Methylamine utilisation protein MauE.
MNWNLKWNLIVEVICALFILLFTYTAITKFGDFSNFRYVLTQSPIIGQHAQWISWLLPVLELAIAASLFIRTTRRYGLMASFVIMIAFTFYIGYMLSFASKLPCSCGGVLQSLSWTQHLIFNIVFTVLAFAALRINRTTNSNAGKKNFGAGAIA